MAEPSEFVVMEFEDLRCAHTGRRQTQEGRGCVHRDVLVRESDDNLDSCCHACTGFATVGTTCLLLEEGVRVVAVDPNRLPQIHVCTFSGGI